MKQHTRNPNFVCLFNKWSLYGLVPYEINVRQWWINIQIDLVHSIWSVFIIIVCYADEFIKLSDICTYNSKSTNVEQLHFFGCCKCSMYLSISECYYVSSFRVFQPVISIHIISLDYLPIFINYKSLKPLITS